MSENLNDSCERGRKKKELRNNDVYWQKYATTASYQNKKQNQIELLELGIELTGQREVNIKDRYPTTQMWALSVTWELIKNVDYQTLCQTQRISMRIFYKMTPMHAKLENHWVDQWFSILTTHWNHLRSFSKS